MFSLLDDQEVLNNGPALQFHFILSILEEKITRKMHTQNYQQIYPFTVKLEYLLQPYLLD